VQIHKPAK